MKEVYSQVERIFRATETLELRRFGPPREVFRGDNPQICAAEEPEDITGKMAEIIADRCDTPRPKTHLLGLMSGPQLTER